MFGIHTCWKRFFPMYNFWQKQERDFMPDAINNLCQMLCLSQYQTNKLKAHCDRYNMSRLQKRGGVLYAPYATRGVWQYMARILFGARADLIAQDKTLLQAQRNIKFCANGYHCVRVGKYTYYADASGNNVSREEFNKCFKD